MIDFNDAELLSVLPENLLQHETQALSAAIKEGLRHLRFYSRAAPLYSAIEVLPDEVLNLLAIELRTQYYEQNARRDIREKMVKQTIAWYLRGGTGAVLKEYLETLFQGGILQEWYTYDGQPYYFRAIVDLALDDVIEVGDGEKIIDRINTYKNVRSWLEALAFQIAIEFKVDIEYDNGIEFQTEVYPRYNLAKLKLDRTWKLDGKKKLNGYDSDLFIDFHPIDYLGFEIDLKEIIESEEETALETEVWTELRAEEGLEFESEEAVEIIEGNITAVEVCIENKISVGEITIYNQNRLDGKWKLNGKRKLNGGTEFR